MEKKKTGAKKMDIKTLNNNRETPLKFKDKQFLIVSDKTNKYFRELKQKIKEKYNVTFTYNKIVEKMIKSIDKEKFEEELKRID